jgi:N-acetylglucosaminyldiphosphoundecaprenol N-acetyl-beta-D-mannosaminyltransferase
MTRIPIGPAALDLVETGSFIQKIKELIDKKIPSQIVTLNSLMFNSAYRNPHLAEIIRNACLVIPDSIGIKWAASMLSGKKISRIPGIDLIDHFCRLSEDFGYKIYFFGSAQKTVENAAKKLSAKYPKIHIAGIHHGYFNPDTESSIISRIRESRADILLVGLNVPKQEIWISQNLKKLNIPIVMGVGGSFDVISGSLRRAPGWLRSMGLEWFFRFVQQPWRIIRIKGLPVFIMNIIKIKLGTSKTLNSKNTMYKGIPDSEK